MLYNYTLDFQYEVNNPLTCFRFSLLISSFFQYRTAADVFHLSLKNYARKQDLLSIAAAAQRKEMSLLNNN